MFEPPSLLFCSFAKLTVGLLCLSCSFPPHISHSMLAFVLASVRRKRGSLCKLKFYTRSCLASNSYCFPSDFIASFMWPAYLVPQWTALLLSFIGQVLFRPRNLKQADHAGKDRDLGTRRPELAYITSPPWNYLHGSTLPTYRILIFYNVYRSFQQLSGIFSELGRWQRLWNHKRGGKTGSSINAALRIGSR